MSGPGANAPASIVLCMDTSGEVCQTAVGIEDQRGFRILTEAAVADRHAHSEHLIGLIDFCLRQSGYRKDQISMIALSIGPGSFTGLRIGVAVAKGLGLALQIPVVPVSTHDAMAYPFRYFPFPLWVMNTARKNEWYVTCYNGGEQTATTIMNAQQWLTAIPSPVMVIADDYSLIQEHITEEKSPLIYFPRTVRTPPDLHSLGTLACQQIQSGKLPDLDEIVPQYIQPFLGKM